MNLLSPEQLALLGLSKEIWKRRGQAKTNGLGFSEETCTETFLLDLARTYPGNATIVPFTKQDEGKTGGDWAWMFESADQRSFFPMLVQAKVLDLRDRKYGKLPHKIGRKRKKPQIDQLIETSKKLGLYPFFAFYNHLSDSTRVPTSCHSQNTWGLRNLWYSSWGISLAHAYDVKSKFPDYSFDIHKNHSFPLHCLLCTRGKGIYASKGSPGAICDKLNDLRSSSLDRESDTRLTETSFQVRLESPPIFEMVREAASLRADQRYDFIGVLRKEYPNVKGVVILKDSDVRQ